MSRSVIMPMRRSPLATGSAPMFLRANVSAALSTVSSALMTSGFAVMTSETFIVASLYHCALDILFSTRHRPQSSARALLRATQRLRSAGASFLIGRDAAPGALCAPDARAQTLELHDLAVIDEEIDVGTVVLHVPLERRRIGGLEHHLLDAQRVDDGFHDVGPPLRNA